MWQAWRNVRRNEKRADGSVVAAAVSWRQRHNDEDDDSDNDVDEAWRRTSCHHPRASSGLIRPSAHLHSYRGECSRTYLLEEYGRLRRGEAGIHSRKRKASSTGKNGYIAVARPGEEDERKRRNTKRRKRKIGRCSKRLDARLAPIKNGKRTFGMEQWWRGGRLIRQHLKISKQDRTTKDPGYCCLNRCCYLVLSRHFGPCWLCP